MRRIITVGREFGSGGREIGRRIAEELQIAYYDQEIITEIAKRTALSEAYIRQIEEKRPVVSFPIHIGHSFYPSSLSRSGERRKTLTCWQTHPALTLKRCLNPYVVTLGLIINE